MAGNDALKPWVLEALRLLGGSGTPTDVAKTVWRLHENELRKADDLFFTWQYDIRWAAQKLRDSGRLQSVEGDRRSRWQLSAGAEAIYEPTPQSPGVARPVGGWAPPPDAMADIGNLFELVRADTTDVDALVNFGSAFAIWVLNNAASSTLVELFPEVMPQLSMASTLTDARIRNAATRSGLRTFGDMSAMQVRAVSNLPGVGDLSVRRLLLDLTREALQSRVSFEDDIASSPHPEGSDPQVGVDRHGEARERWLRQAEKDLATVARWRALLGQPNSPLLREVPSGDEPLEVLAARERLGAISAATVLGDSQKSAAQLIDDALSLLDNRSVEVLRDRLFAEDPVTLDVLGDRFSVTRERVRQIESRAKAALRATLSSPPGAALFGAVRAHASGVSLLESVLQELPGLRGMVQIVDVPVWRVLDRLDDEYEVEHGWCAAPSLRAAKGETRDVVSRLGDDELPTVGQVAAALTAVTVPEERLPDWLLECGYSTVSGHVLSRGDGIRERARAVLQLSGEPLPATVILERLGVERSLTAVKNVLSANSPGLFTRVDRGEVYGLSAWGLSEYTTIRDLIRRELAESGGSMPLATLVDRLTSRFSVAPTSVVAYASGFPFEVRGGSVCLASERQTVGGSPWRTRRLYRVGHAWHLRTELTDDHARGAGSLIPTALAAAIGLVPGEVLELVSRLGPQPVTAKGLQPSLGSVRRFIQADGLSVGEPVIFSFSDDGVFDLRPISTEGTTISDAALALIGSQGPGASAHPLTALAAAVGMSMNNGIAGVIDAYRSRGDDDVAELLELM